MEIIKNLLTMGFDWNFIFKATGVDQDGFRELKEKWRNLELATS